MILSIKIFKLKVHAHQENASERERKGGVSALGGHMTRKMWDLIPVLDCSQLLKLCPSQCKLLIYPITTSGPRVDSARRNMSGKSRRGSVDTRRGPSDTGTDRTRAARIILQKYHELIRGLH